jgi:hypothetical protein
MAEEFEIDMGYSEEDQLVALEHELDQAYNVALLNRQMFFPANYLDGDMYYSVDREFDEAWAQASQDLDLYPAPHFERASQLRGKAVFLTSVFILLSLSLLFYTLAEGLHRSRGFLRYGAAFVATACLLLGIVTVAAIELLI